MAVSNQWFVQWSSPSVVFADVNKGFNNVNPNWKNYNDNYGNQFEVPSSRSIREYRPPAYASKYGKTNYLNFIDKKKTNGKFNF
ncbi:unnamed protein product [Euphydryas editha]|uniref:Uncharacterized protein n=1 Tax=Euphydryas editha TaxID=104508 RepID=A0AAU9V4Z9_EUPED|nr:unnamed protein product [Euphydryas editha]